MGGGIEDKVRQIIVEQLDVRPEQVVPEARLVEDLGVDSLDTVELVMALEEAFGFEMPDEDTDKIRTVGDIIEYVRERIEKTP